MQSKIHPRYFKQATVSCACGAVLTTGSTKEIMDIEICSNCHPLYTGKKKTIDTTGRVDRFKKIAEKAEALKAAQPKASKKEKTSVRKEKKVVAKTPKISLEAKTIQ